MSYDDNGSWDHDRAFERDQSREVGYPQRRTARLDATGSVRAATMPKCTRDHEALKLDESAWSALKHVGSMPSYDDPGKPDLLELRNCSCGSTLARPYFAQTKVALQILIDAELL